MTSTSLSIDSVYEEKGFPVKSGKDALGQGVKNEARILGKVILDTWRFILGYIAKYRWILFRGSFLLSDSVFSRFHWVWKRQTSSPQRGAGTSTEAVQFQGKCQLIQHDFYFTVH